MHADTLYHRMLDQEKAMEAAKAEGKPIPKFDPIISQPSPKQSPEDTESTIIPGIPAEAPKTKPSELAPHIQARLKDRLKGLSEAERQVEEMAIMDEMRAGEKVAGKLGTIFEAQGKGRREREEKGAETVVDRLMKLFTGR